MYDSISIYIYIRIGWTFAFEDYYEQNLTKDLDTDAFQDLLRAADPYSFFDRYQGKWKMPIDAVNV